MFCANPVVTLHTCHHTVVVKSQLRQAEIAFNGGKVQVARDILAETGPFFDAMGVWPDSQAPVTTLAGRCVDSFCMLAEVAGLSVFSEGR